MDKHKKKKNTHTQTAAESVAMPPAISRSPTARKIRTGMIINALMDGKNLRDAAISAGYSPNSASQAACEALKHPETKQLFAQVMERAGISDDFLARKIKNLLDAKETKHFQRDGVVTETREVDALETQRKTTELATKLKGHLKDRSEVDINIGLMAMVVAAVKTVPGDDGGEND